jgi:NADH-quinone oxidoreductase subunit J
MLSVLAQSSSSDATALSAALFYLFALMSAVSAIGVVFSRNIVRTAVCLLFTLIGVAGLYFLLSAEFLAAVQLVVYAGGTLILIIFGVMLTSKSPFSRFEPKLAEIIIALSLGSILLVALIAGIVRTRFATDAMQSGGYPVDKLGQTLLGDYLVPFELASVLLLVVMIGAAYLAKGRRREAE